MTLRVAAILAVLLAALVTGGPTSAAAADTDALVAVEISAVTPANPQPGGQLKVSGVLRNISSVRLRDVGARMQVSTVPLTVAQEVLAVADGASVRIGDVVTQRPGFVTLEPEGQTPFELTAPLDSIGFTEPGVYEVRIDSVDGAAAILGTRSTTVPWFPPGSVPDPASVVFLWPLFGVPARDADDVFLTTAVAAEVNPAGRLRTLVDTGAAHAGQVSWVIDPQTLQSVELLTRPYQLLVDDGTAAAQPADAGAAAWLAVVNRATGGTADVTAAGYADPDSVAEVSAGLLSDLVLATTTSSALLSEQLGRSVRGAFSWPANGSLDQPTLNALRGAGVQHVVLASDVVGGGAGAPLVRLSTDSGPITAVVGDGELAVALGSMTNNPATAVQARHLFLSMVALRALADAGPTLVAAPPDDWAPSQPALDELLTALDGAEYARLQTLGATVAALEATAPEGELLTSSEVT
ncbi:MAG: hypothetical protein QG597_1997, partial [Actinomycetota bacterium]|nr:hypothetical protein [Actinomycetota bacterium]